MAKFDVAVHSVVLDDQKRILLAHRRDMDLWDLPGGGVEHGELPTEAAIRETLEETGVVVEVERLLAVVTTIPPETALGFLFSGHPVGGEILTGEESDGVRFFALDELPEKLSPRKLAMIQTAMQNPTETIFTHVTLPKAKQYLDVYGSSEDKTDSHIKS
jgi:ADP-ribose pyrophosphatase YjhB (NUDIX family)